MKRRWQKFWFGALTAAALLSVADSLCAVPVTAETRDWDAAVKVLKDSTGPTVAGVAETKFADFVKKYPNSEHYAEAIVREAQAQLIQQKYEAMITLLAAEWPHAGTYADQFAYLTAQAFEKQKNYLKAADNYARLAQENPDSPLRAKAIYGQAEAHSKIPGQWAEVILELGRPDGPFQELVKTNAVGDPDVLKGLLLLGRAYWEQKDYVGAEKVLTVLPTDKLSDDLKWDRLSLLCRVLLAEDKPKEALQNSTNLLTVAGNNPGLKAKSYMLQGSILESLGQFTDAIRTYELNLSADLPVEQRTDAMLRIVELLRQQNQTEEAGRRLEEYLTKHPEERGTDFGLLMLGDMRLQQYYQSMAATSPTNSVTNLLQLAKVSFQQLIKQFPNSPYVGKALLDLGWCYLNEGNIAESQTAFSGAASRLPVDKDWAVAHFKLGELYLKQTNYAAAVTDYAMIIAQYRPIAVDKSDSLFEIALYQIVQAELARNNVAGAEEATKKILDWFPNGQLGDRSVLLLGQEEKPERAREVFVRLINERPQSALLPDVKLAIARTYEKDGKWAEAMAQYKAWVSEYPSNAALPRAEYNLAVAEFNSGNETNALIRFTNFVARFQTNTLPQDSKLPTLAQLWVGDYYWGKKDYQDAVRAYKEVFTKWPDSDLALEAYMRAGRSSAAIPIPQEAISYFTELTAKSNCPPELKAQALFARADATLMLSTTNRAIYDEAMNLFRLVTTTYTNNPISALAWGRLGNCYYALAGADTAQPDTQRSYYTNSSNAFQMVINSPLADITMRSKAEIELGDTMMKLAEVSAPADAKQLRNVALDHWMTVMHGENVRVNQSEQADWGAVENATIRAGKFAEDMGDWNQAVQFYQSVLEHFPSMQKRIDRVRQLQSQTEKK